MTAQSKAPTNEKQKKFFDVLIENDGNVRQAAEVVGYGREYAYHLARKYRDYLLERVEGSLCLDSIRAAAVVSKTLYDDGKSPGAKARFDAALQVLDRIGVVKQDRMKVEVEGQAGIVLLPAKDDD